MVKAIDDKKLEEIIKMDTTIDGYYEKFLCMSGDQNAEILRKYIRELCFSENSRGKKSGILYNNGCLQENISHHNNQYLKDFKNSEATGYECILKVELLENSKDYKQGRFNINFNDIFKEESLQNMTEVELCAHVMQWSNRATKYLDKVINSSYDDKEKVRYRKITKDLLKKGLNSEFCMNYQYFKDMKDKEIKDEMDEEEFEEYKSVRRAIRERLNADDCKDVDYDDLIKYFTVEQTQIKLYSIKDSMIRQLVYKIEAGGDPKAKHYVRKDKKSGSKDLTCSYLYGVTIDGYSEPFEVHVCTDETRAERFSKVISYAEERIENEKSKKQKINIPSIYEMAAVKSGMPFKLNYTQQKSIEGLIRFENNDSQLQIINQLLNSSEYIMKNADKAKEFYTSSGVEGAQVIKE